MSEETSPRDPALPPPRRVVRAPERGLLPIAVIAREGEERDQLETQLERTRPVVVFPSISHFMSDARRERWAGILVARTHAWDARLDDYVPRRAFIALFRLADEGYGWPDAVKRLSVPEELDGWLAELAAPELPADDKPRPVKQKRPRNPRAASEARSVHFALAPSRGHANDQLALSGLEPQLGPGQTPPTTAAGNAANTSGHAENPERTRSERPKVASAGANEARTESRAARSRPPTRAVASAGSFASGRRGKRSGAELGGPASTPEHARGPTHDLYEQAYAVVRGVPRASARAQSEEERRLCALALEIGLARATELLSLVRTRAQTV